MADILLVPLLVTTHVGTHCVLRGRGDTAITTIAILSVLTKGGPNGKAHHESGTAIAGGIQVASADQLGSCALVVLRTCKPYL